MDLLMPVASLNSVIPSTGRVSENCSSISKAFLIVFNLSSYHQQWAFTATIFLLLEIMFYSLG
jgi:hypothetical protein